MIRYYTDEHGTPYALTPNQNIEGVTLTPITEADYTHLINARLVAATNEERSHQKALKAAATAQRNRKEKARALLPPLQEKLTTLGFTTDEIALLINPID